MVKRAHPFICQNCGTVCARGQRKCEACAELGRAPRSPFASLLMSVPFGDLERDYTPVRDVDL